MKIPWESPWIFVPTIAIVAVALYYAAKLAFLLLLVGVAAFLVKKFLIDQNND
jgi:flagellar biogenesis protein FliO